MHRFELLTIYRATSFAQRAGSCVRWAACWILAVHSRYRCRIKFKPMPYLHESVYFHPRQNSLLVCYNPHEINSSSVAYGFGCRRWRSWHACCHQDLKVHHGWLRCTYTLPHYDGNQRTRSMRSCNNYDSLQPSAYPQCIYSQCIWRKHTTQAALSSVTLGGNPICDGFMVLHVHLKQTNYKQLKTMVQHHYQDPNLLVDMWRQPLKLLMPLPKLLWHNKNHRINVDPAGKAVRFTNSVQSVCWYDHVWSRLW